MVGLGRFLQRCNWCLYKKLGGNFRLLRSKGEHGTTIAQAAVFKIALCVHDATSAMKGGFIGVRRFLLRVITAGCHVGIPRSVKIRIRNHICLP